MFTDYSQWLFGIVIYMHNVADFQKFFYIAKRFIISTCYFFLFYIVPSISDSDLYPIHIYLWAIRQNEDTFDEISFFFG